MLALARNLSLPDEAVTETFALLGKRGSGKTYTTAVLIEAMLAAHLRAVVIDPMGIWWSLRSSADGKGPGFPIAIFGGEHGDIPLEPSSGGFVAGLVVEENLSLVLDVSEFSKGDRKKFVTDFLEKLYRINREPIHVVLEESDLFAPQRPQRGEERMLGAVEDVVRRGRGKGIGISLISQRSAVLNKDVLTQTEVLFALRTPSPQDRAAIESWLDAHVERDQRHEIMATLPSLPVGEAWISSPGWLQILRRVRVRKRRTFDASATPKVGQRRRTPRTLADVNLIAIKEQMAETIERAKADDPKELRRRIAALEKELRAVRLQPGPEPVVERVEVEVIPEWWPTVVEQLHQGAEAVENALRRARNVIGNSPLKERPVERTEPVPRVDPTFGPSKKPSLKPSPAGITSIQQRTLNSLAWFDSVGKLPVDKHQLALHSASTAKSGHFNNSLSNLHVRGFVAYPRSGEVTLTEEGAQYAEPSEAIRTTEELQEAVLSKLGSLQQRILRVLVEMYPNAITKDALATAVGSTTESGHFNNTVSALRTLKLLDYPEKGSVVATDALFL